MTEAIQDAQAVLLATVLVTACLTKLVVRVPGPPAPAEIHGVPVPAEPRWTGSLRDSRAAIIGVSAMEGGLAVALLLSAHLSVRVAAVLAFAAATWVVVELRNRRPDSGCGCFGGLSTKRVGRRSVVRAALLTAAAIGSLGGTESGVRVLAEHPGPVGLLLVFELAVFAAVSPELGVLLRQRAPVPCERRRSPLAETYATLHGSDLWRDHRRLLTGEQPLDVWREHCWRFLVYPARLDEQEVEIVFAVSTAERHRAVLAAVSEAEWQPVPDDGVDDAGLHRVATSADDGTDVVRAPGEDTGPNSQYATL